MPNVDFVDTKRYETERADIMVAKAWDDDNVEKLFSAKNLAKTKLKQIVRNGVPDGIRSLVWPEFLRMHKMHDYDKNFKMALFRVHGINVPDLDIYPQFGGSFPLNLLYLSSKGVFTVGRILTIIAYDYPNVEYCPFIPALTSLLLHHVGPDDVLGTLNHMLKSSLANPNVWTYFPTYKADIKAFNFAFTELVQAQLPKLGKRLTNLNSTDKPLWARWFCDMFVTVFPLQYVFHIIDCYLIEGHKVLFRYALGFLNLLQSKLLKLKTWAEVQQLVTLTQPFPFQLHEISKKAFSYKFSKLDLLASRNSFASNRNGRFHTGSLSDLMMVQLSTTSSPWHPKFSESSPFMTSKLWTSLWSWIPLRYQHAQLELVFTTRKHGRSINTFYELTREREPTILLLETMLGEIIGAFCSVTWPLHSQQLNRFFGTGETFVFQLTPSPQNFPWAHANQVVGNWNTTEPESTLQLPSPTSNTSESSQIGFEVPNHSSSFMFAGARELIIGGGGQGHALWINESLTSGRTDTCYTFQNPPLVPSKNFEISNLDIYSFRQPD
ncbi:hypothetical protein HMI54_007362 [Coelomomyces lativittatus]|nr:hypothetical protein HMI55_006148 [Coelomomyces lativittatus]KAJ1513013.1 hypothetical protein HMI56_003182 [Coelomomyces lativittatus]KAJ1517025.1 hypothetical protein HMI54_007362 [Coelomomyces lativittatus]